MNENKDKKSVFKWLDKFKKIKHIEIYIAIIFVVVLMLIYFSNFNSKSTKTDKQETTSNQITINEYVDNLENNLEEILCNIGGVSNVKVMVTLDMSEATINDSLITTNGFPSIKGVVIVANGVNDTSRKMKVLHAVETVVDITNGSIEILSGE